MTGVDSEPKLLAAAAERPGGGDVRWLDGDLLALPAGDGEFDRGHVGLRRDVRRDAPVAPPSELARVLAPGGTIALANWIPEGPIVASHAPARRRARRVRRGPGPSWGSEADVRALFEPHGLTLAAERRELAFEGGSPHDWLSLQERASPPLQEPREQLLARGRWDELRAAIRPTWRRPTRTRRASGSTALAAGARAARVARAGAQACWRAAVRGFSSGLIAASICARRDSRNGGSESFSPSVSSGSSAVKPGLGVAISKRIPLGSRK